MASKDIRKLAVVQNDVFTNKLYLDTENITLMVKYFCQNT